MKNVLIVTPVRLELTARGLKVRCSKPTELRGCVFKMYRSLCQIRTSGFQCVKLTL